MAGLLGYAAAGALSGVGEGLVMDWKAKREDAIRAAENARDDRIRGEERAFQTQRDERNFQQQKELGKISRGYQVEDRNFAADREDATGGEYVTGEDGTLQRLRGDRTYQVLDGAGNAVEGVTAGKAGSRTTMTPTDKRQVFALGVKEGKPAVDMDPQDWETTLATWEANGLDPNEFIDYVTAGLKSDAKKLGEADPDAYVQRRLGELGLAGGAPAAPASAPRTGGGLMPDEPAPDAPKRQFSDRVDRLRTQLEGGTPSAPAGEATGRGAPVTSGDEAPPPGYPNARKHPKLGWVVQKPDGSWVKLEIGGNPEIPAKPMR